MNTSSRSRAVALLIGAFALSTTPALVAQQPSQPAQSPVQPQAQTKTDAPSPLSFTGEFDSNGVRLSLEQTGTDVTGTLLLGDLPCAVKGTVKDGVLSAQVTIERDVEEITAKFEDGKLLVSDKDATLTFERVKTDQPTRISHPGGLDFILPVGWSNRDMQGKLQFMPPKGIVKASTAIIAEVQDWAHDKPITDPVGLEMFRAGFKQSLPTFDDLAEPQAIALGNDTGILLRLKGNTEQLEKVYVSVYLRTIGKKIAVIMVIADAEDVANADTHCKSIMTDVVTPGATQPNGPALTLDCPQGWKQITTKGSITLFPPVKEGETPAGDFIAVTDQPWIDTLSFFEAMTPKRVDDEIRIAFANSKRVGDVDRLGEKESDGLKALFQARATPEDDRVVEIRLKKLGSRMVLQMWMGPKALLDSRQSAIAAVFKSLAVTGTPTAPSTPPTETK